jgi:hypothetical protein
MEPAFSIASVSATPSVQPEDSGRKRPVAVHSSAHVGSNSARVPNRENAASKDNASPHELPQDEVHVQRDAKNDGRIVIRYLDHSGNLILQIPSEQLLALARAVDEVLAQRPEDTGATAAGQIEGQKEVHYGNQS